MPLGVNGYSYGGAAYGVVWFDAYSVRKLVVTLTDNDNTSGYIEVSRLIAGSYWTPENNAEHGVGIVVQDSSKNERSDAGDLFTARGTLSKVISIDLKYMTASDRNSLWNLVRGSGMHKPVYFSLVPEADDPSEEQIYQVFGKVSKQSAIQYQFVNQFSSKLDLEEI